ncbi:uncharacterized protein BDZ99DRAFT_435993 [Mytilinidion resinicola]|uniref:NAD(P)-binding domain-containing protein n=1 Tax=Mytilinidion resinicola TaxID=574789 RepID=A0A6A6Z5K5_9PEZI|nr:uncharacterized protein BDZ99DRAFT_435993 [Mytilinidion resinicola]KAF2815574.1 hypothetical protein BDZ99DRAFT_435993 [Mytilinidion resinicola]
MPSRKSLNIGIIGPAGFGGSYLCVELLNRGHKIVGISRFPSKLGKNPSYEPRSIDVTKASIQELAEAFKGLEVLVNEYGPHTAGEGALQYQPFLELTRKIVLAAKSSKVNYFIMVGGCGSLHMPDKPFQSVCESNEWWLAYRRGIADSEAHVSYMEDRLGSMGFSLRGYRNARKLQREGEATEESRAIIAAYEEKARSNDSALVFVTACRTSFMFFDGNTSFRWTYISPPALYRPGPRSGRYEVIFDEIPLKSAAKDDPSDLEGRLHGITAADLAIAIADEAEEQTRVGRHWSAYGDLSEDTPYPSYVTIS